MASRIFVTGASGYLGSAIAARLVRAGHEVHGLTRVAQHARRLADLGVRPLIGDLAALPPEAEGVLRNCDAVVHAAFDPDDPPLRDQQSLEAFRRAAQDGRLRRLIYTSGVWVQGDTGSEVADERTPLAPLELVRWRAAHEEVAIDLGVHEVEAVVFRPAMVYGERRGFLAQWFTEAREKRTVTYFGDGSQRWSVVHRDDVADAYALGLEHARGGERFILSDENHFTVRELADAVARVTGAVPQAWPAREVERALGPAARGLLATIQTTAVKARRELGWVPRHPSFVGEAGALLHEWRQATETAAHR